MKQKWGVAVQDYAQKEGLPKKSPKDVEGSGQVFLLYNHYINNFFNPSQAC